MESEKLEVVAVRHKRKIRFIGGKQTALVWIILGGIIIVFGILCGFGTFLSAQNINVILEQGSVLGFLAAGQTFVILTGGIDLSIGGIVAFSGVITALTMLTTNIPLGILAGIAIGFIMGLSNGVVSVYLRVPPFVTTLAVGSITAALALIFSNGQPIWDLPGGFYFLGSGEVIRIPFISLMMILSFFVSFWFLVKTAYGRHVYATGGNIIAARANGINTNLILISVYTISGLLSGIGGVFDAARLQSAQPLAGLDEVLPAIAAVVLGGTSLFGGEGSALGTLGGVFIMTVITNGMNVMALSPYWQGAVEGFVLIGAIAMAKLIA